MAADPAEAAPEKPNDDAETADEAASGERSDDRESGDPVDLFGEDDELGRAGAYEEYDRARYAALGSLDPMGAFRFDSGATGDEPSRSVRVRARTLRESLIAGRDINIGVAASRPIVELAPPIPPRAIDVVARSYVPPSGYPDLELRLRESAMVILRAPRRWGATSTAVRLLSSLGAVHEVKTEGDLATLPVRDLPRKSGFILDGLAPEQVAEFRALEATTLEQQLADREAKAVIVIDDSVKLLDHGTERWVLPLSAPPPADEMVESHLAELIGSSEAARLLAGSGLREWLSSVEPERFDAHLLVALAHDLAEVASGRGDLEGAMAAFDERSKQSVAAWVDSIADDDQALATVCALAVYNGTSYDVVRRAASSLSDAWSSLLDGGATAAAGRVPGRRSKRLTGARARVTIQSQRTRYGSVETPVASFIDASYPTQVLDYVWSEYDDYAEALLTWLASMSEDDDVRVGIRAATAIGYLGRTAFPRVRGEVIGPWARDGGGRERECAVAALSTIAKHAPTAPVVAEVVADWSRKTSSELRMTAARALGSAVGPVMPAGPDRHLESLAKRADKRLSVAIGVSVRELLAEAGAERRTELVLMMDRWAREPLAGRHRAGIASFLWCASLYTTASEDQSRWPLLLRLSAGLDLDTVGEAGSVEAVRTALARLLGESLLSPGFDRELRGALRSWALAAEGVEPVRRAMIALCQEAAKTRRQSAELMYHAKRWRSDQQTSPEFAAQLITALNRKA